MTGPTAEHLLVVGAQRCGTTFLSTALDAHPEITMARPARPEPKAFCDGRAAARGRAWYVDTFFAHATAERYLGDKSTSYLEDSDAPARARAVLGEAQVLVVLRDPVERAISNWRFSTRNGLETRPLEVALEENLTGRTPWDPAATSVSPFAYLERGRYLDYLLPWFASFPHTVHVLFLPELLAGPHGLGDLWKTLGVDPAGGQATRTEAVNSSSGETPLMSEALRGTLEEYFEAGNRALSERLGRPLPW